MTPRLLLQLSLPPEWDHIEVVRQAVGLCVGAVFGTVTVTEAIAMVSSELLENGIKHGVPEAPVLLAIEESADVFSVVVTNSVPAAASASALVDRLAWMATFADPQAAYTAAMQKSFDEMSDGGLGLPRIAYEGGCHVSCDTSSPGEVTVRARLAAPSTSAAP